MKQYTVYIYWFPFSLYFPRKFSIYGVLCQNQYLAYIWRLKKETFSRKQWRSTTIYCSNREISSGLFKTICQKRWWVQLLYNYCSKPTSISSSLLEMQIFPCFKCLNNFSSSYNQIHDWWIMMDTKIIKLELRMLIRFKKLSTPYF